MIRGWKSPTPLVLLAGGVLSIGAFGCQRPHCAEERRVATERGITEECVSAEEVALADTIRRRLAREPGLETARIRVSVVAGSATLAGETDDERSMRRAEKLAYGIDGVERVENDILVVRPPPNPRTLSEPTEETHP